MPEPYNVPYILTAAGLVMLAAALGALWMLLARRRNLDMRSLPLARFLEPVILLLLLPLLAAWNLFTPQPSKTITETPLLADLIGPRLFPFWIVFFAFTTLPILAAVRWLSSRFAVLVISLGWILGSWFFFLAWKTLPVLQAIAEADTLGLFQHQLLVPYFFIFPRVWVWMALTVLGGFYAVRFRFHWALYILGCLGAGYAAYFALMPFWAWEGSWLCPLFFTAFATGLIALPIQRSAFVQLFNISLVDTPRRYNTVRPAASFLGHACLLLFAAFVAFSAAVNYFERDQVRDLEQGPRKFAYSPALRNAFDAMDPLFIKSADRKLSERNSISSIEKPADHNTMMMLLEPATSQSLSKAWETLDPTLIRNHLGNIAQYLAAYEEASEAEYLQAPGATGLNFLNIRETSRYLAVRSQLASYEGRVLDAAHDIHTIMRFGSLLADQPLLVAQAIGLAVRNIALKTAYNFLVTQNSSEEGLEALNALLQKVQPVYHRGLDLGALQRGELGTFRNPVIPYFEYVIPGMRRIADNLTQSWQNYDLLRIGTALELYRLQNGGYPGDLSELAPGYLERVPRNPADGSEYQYKVLQRGKSYNLAQPPLFENADSTFVLPPPAADETTGTVSQ